MLASARQMPEAARTRNAFADGQSNTADAFARVCSPTRRTIISGNENWRLRLVPHDAMRRIAPQDEGFQQVASTAARRAGAALWRAAKAGGAQKARHEGRSNRFSTS